VLGEVLLGDQVLALASLAVDDRDPRDLAHARTRREKRPAIRMRWVLSRSSSLSPCHPRHQTRKPPGECPIEK
jgi:hypothetical protein